VASKDNFSAPRASTVRDAARLRLVFLVAGIAVFALLWRMLGVEELRAALA
jgi:hypothetical protein